MSTTSPSVYSAAQRELVAIPFTDEVATQMLRTTVILNPPTVTRLADQPSLNAEIEIVVLSQRYVVRLPPRVERVALPQEPELARPVARGSPTHAIGEQPFVRRRPARKPTDVNSSRCAMVSVDDALCSHRGRGPNVSRGDGFRGSRRSSLRCVLPAQSWNGAPQRLP